MIFCYFCGGKVEILEDGTFRCIKEGKTWTDKGLVTYEPR